ncbi:MAG: hypothetical protein IJT43_10650 [Stomatobaculum sp.]|nr:hypothetical protein [Stomatobaculum sp.]
MKKLGLAIITAAAVAGMTVTAFAGEWENTNAGWKYKNDDGTYKKAEWFTDEATGNNYLFNADGIMMTGDVTVSGIPYFFDENGVLARNVYFKDTEEVAADDGILFKVGADHFLAGQFVTFHEDGDMLYVNVQNFGSKPITMQGYVELTGDGIDETWYTYNAETGTLGEEMVIQPMEKAYVPVIAEDMHKVDFANKTVDVKLRYALGDDIYWVAVPAKPNVEGQHLLIKGCVN